ncbi:TRAP transporter small permease [Cobetia sp. MMG027]|uniref:TRAP transporter small permease n=1 Tax=Cobetia sp. MMG027 TaxID=3021980 RepID=UPI0022FE74B9|nr:TRAP transporter small permease [Cobetia sp. MMG027]MDA5563306.1 TRAP transporter small permease [Cobetia sp. MMG027]
MLTLLARVHDGVTRAGFLLGGVTLCGIVLCFWLEVIARYFFNSPTLWSGAMVAYLLCLSISLAAPELARTHGHIAITVLPERLSSATRALYDRLLALITGGVCAVAGWICLQESLRQFQYHTTTAMGLDIPKVWVSSFIAYALINAALYFLRHAFTRAAPEATPSDDSDSAASSATTDARKGP